MPWRADQEFVIAVAAGDRGGDDARDGPAERRDAMPITSAQTCAWTAGSRTMPFLTCVRPGLELRLDQRDQPRPRARASASAAGSTSLSEMKLTSTVTRSGGSSSRAGSSLRMSVASIATTSGRAAQARVQLPASDVDRIDAPRAAREQHLGEAAGRGADVEADAAGRIEPEMIERGRELHAAARHPGMRRRRLQRGVGGDLLGRLGDGDAVGGHHAGGDRLLRLGAALEQAALDQQPVGAHALCHGISIASPLAAPWLRRGLIARERWSNADGTIVPIRIRVCGVDLGPPNSTGEPR